MAQSVAPPSLSRSALVVWRRRLLRGDWRVVDLELFQVLFASFFQKFLYLKVTRPSWPKNLLRFSTRFKRQPIHDIARRFSEASAHFFQNLFHDPWSCRARGFTFDPVVVPGR